MNRAYSTITIKAAEAGGKRTFTGVASTPSTDRMGDIVEPKGAQFKLPIPLLWQHDARQPIGWITKAKVTAAGIEVEGEVADIAEEGSLKQRLTEAWQMLKAGLVRGLSIGFNSIESARIEGTWGLHFLKWEWLELSAVTIAANQDASITSIKSIDEQHLAALGRKGAAGDRNRPGAAGQHAANSGANRNRQKGTAMKTLKELLEARATKHARQKELIDTREAEKRAFSDEEGAEFDLLADEVKELDDDIRVARYHAANASTAKTVEGGSREEGSRSRSSNIIVRGSDVAEKFKGQNYVRRLIAKAIAMHTHASPIEVAEARWGKSAPTLVRLIKAGVAGGSTDTWGNELVNADANYTGDFIEFLYGMTVFDKLPLTRVPANVLIKGQDGAGTGYWVGESKAIPATTLDFFNVELTPLKVAALCVVSNELLMDASPDAEQIIRNALAEASAQRVDTTFLSTAAAVSGVSPAGILNGLSAGTASGTDADAIRADILALYSGFITAKNASGLALVTTPSLAKAIALMTNALGQVEFPGLGAAGGQLLGDQVYTGDNVGAGDLILLKPRDIYRIGDTGVQVSMSREAMIEQDTAPTGATDTPAAATANMVSMFQEESTAFKVVRRINFAKRRASAVAYIGNAAYGPTGS